MAHSKSHAKHLKKRKQEAAQMADILFGYSGDRHLIPGSLERRNQRAAEANETLRKIMSDEVDKLFTAELHRLGTNGVTCLPTEYKGIDGLFNNMQEKDGSPSPLSKGPLDLEK